MDDRNGENFERHDELYGQLNTSDSEHECLREFLMDTEDTSRNVPCNKPTNDLNNCVNNSIDSSVFSQSSLEKNNCFTNNIDHVSRTEGTEFPINCEELNVQPSVSGSNSMKPFINKDKTHNGNVLNKKKEEMDVEENEPSVILQETGNTSISTKVQTSQEDASNSYSKCIDISIPSVSPKSLTPKSPTESDSRTNIELENGKVSKLKRVETRGRKRKVPGSEPVKVKSKKIPVSSKVRVKVPGAGRGRPPGPAKKKQQPVTYQSQISPDQNGIKLFIKKSSTTTPIIRPSKQKERVKKRKTKKGVDTDESSGESSVKRVRWKGVGEKEGLEEDDSMREQSDWGLRMPVPVLHKIFLMITHEDGCLPFLARMSRVCRLWHGIASTPSLWHNIDLSGRMFKEKCKNNIKFQWLCENRLTRVQDLNLGGWKFPVIQTVLNTISNTCEDLRGINMTAWKGLTADNLKFLIGNCQLLSRIDLTSICPETNNNKGALSLLSLTYLAQTVGERLTHLTLANNKLSGFPQILTALATHCPNLQVLDLSNMKTGSQTTAPLHIERLQVGCPKLRVLRITNSEMALSPTPLTEQAASPGFPLLEELSVAGIGIDGLCSTPVIDNNSIERILKSSNKLRLLDVRGCTRITDSSLVRVPAWDLEHLFLSGCYVTDLELIAQKWCHSLIEIDLAWSTATRSLDLAVAALAECDSESPLRVLNLCGSSVSLEPVKKVLRKCPHLISLNLASCRGLPRGIKRHYVQKEVDELRGSFEDPPRLPETNKKLTKTNPKTHPDVTETTDGPSEIPVESAAIE